MKLSAALFKLIPTHKFGISRESNTEYTTILLKLEKNGYTGYGEAFPSRRYEHSAETNYSILTGADFSVLDQLTDQFQSLPLQSWLSDTFEHIDSLASGLSAACYDYFGRKWGITAAEFTGSQGLSWPKSSFTIGIDELDIIEQKVREAGAYPLLKIKLGTDQDEEIMGLIRELTDKPLRVDANEGWDREQALERITWLASQNVEFIEQPIPAGNYDDIRWLTERSPLPVIADEDCRHIEDLPDVLSCYDGINIKLVKCGGITPALQMIHTAKTFGKSIMLGCMVESSAGIAPAAVLGGLVDYLDLDGNLLLSNDPFDGPRAEKGRFPEFTAPGMGVSETTDIEWETLYQT